ncbi:MAG: geranylgeranylglyceryl/heptaprenylglyceryl phosphate synthase, partial [Candidatus Aenigmarchaeota archaeon]|nr:geranylgeranylglyceryl/heptaprenylglyceryl phosphate synthase [Candidatus Aenigmarchaeota archaeon]
MKDGKIFRKIKKKLNSGKRLHFTLIDPDPKKVTVEDVKWKTKQAEKFGTDAIMIGGSTGITRKYLDKIVKTVKSCSSLPTILFPNGVDGVSKYADAIFFMSLLNSRDPFWISYV